MIIVKYFGEKLLIVVMLFLKFMITITKIGVVVYDCFLMQILYHHKNWSNWWVQVGVHYGGVFYEFVPWNGVVSWDVDPWGHWFFSAENETYMVTVLVFSPLLHEQWTHISRWSCIDFVGPLLIRSLSSRLKWKWPQKIRAHRCALPRLRPASLQLARTLVLVILECDCGNGVMMEPKERYLSFQILHYFHMLLWLFSSRAIYGESPTREASSWSTLPMYNRSWVRVTFGTPEWDL